MVARMVLKNKSWLCELLFANVDILYIDLEWKGSSAPHSNKGEYSTYYV